MEKKQVDRKSGHDSNMVDSHPHFLPAAKPVRFPVWVVAPLSAASTARYHPYTEDQTDHFGVAGIAGDAPDGAAATGGYAAATINDAAAATTAEDVQPTSQRTGIRRSRRRAPATGADAFSNEGVPPKHRHVVGVVLTLTHPYNAVRGYRTGSNNSEAEDYLRSKTNKKKEDIHTITETNRIP